MIKEREGKYIEEDEKERKERKNKVCKNEVRKKANNPEIMKGRLEGKLEKTM